MHQLACGSWEARRSDRYHDRQGDVASPAIKIADPGTHPARGFYELSSFHDARFRLVRCGPCVWAMSRGGGRLPTSTGLETPIIELADP
jgi:hypothetical protein